MNQSKDINEHISLIQQAIQEEINISVSLKTKHKSSICHSRFLNVDKEAIIFEGSDSKVIDPYDPNESYEAKTDIDGEPRLMGNNVDIGADERACYQVGQHRYYDENMDPGPNTTQANYDAWVACGYHDCWCCPHHGYGDVNGDGWINPSDVSIVWNAFMEGILPPIPPQYARCDVNHDGWINASDVTEVWNRVLQGVPQLPNSCTDCQ